MSMSANINAGKYKNTLPNPSKPEIPAVLKKRASELTADELSSLMKVKADHEAAIEAMNKARIAYRDEDARLEALFRSDMEAEYGMVGHPKADMLYSKADELGHSGGFSEIHNYYSELVELVL